MLFTLKASVAAAVLAGTALVSAGAGYVVSRATMTTQVAVSCPPPIAAVQPQLPWALPNGPVPKTTGGEKF